MPTFRRILMVIERTTSLQDEKLLLHKREISKLDEATARQGMTLVPTQVYLKNGRIKIEVGVARGKKLYDKREADIVVPSRERPAVKGTKQIINGALTHFDI